MAMESNHGQTATFMKGTGGTMIFTDKVNLHFIAEISMKVNMTKVNVVTMAYFTTLKAGIMKAIGKIMYAMDKESTLGLMVMCIMAGTNSIRDMEWANWNITTKRNTKEIILKATRKDTGHSLGQMEECTKEVMRIITEMGLGYLRG